MYNDLLLNGGFLHRDDLENIVKGELKTKNENVEKAIIDWMYKYNLKWAEIAALGDQYNVFEDVVEQILDDKLKDEIINFLENTHGFSIQR